MKFVRTINWEIFNWDELSHVNYEMPENNRSTTLYPYFHLKNGKKLDAFETVDYFNIRGEKTWYYFCCRCCTIFSEILLLTINEWFENGNDFFDIEKHDDSIWDKFISWAEINEDILRVKKNKNDNNGEFNGLDASFRTVF